MVDILEIEGDTDMRMPMITLILVILSGIGSMLYVESVVYGRGIAEVVGIDGGRLVAITDEVKRYITERMVSDGAE